MDNLALACVSCSLRKGAREVAMDPVSGKPVPIFNPRRDHWANHFEWVGIKNQGRTVTGRATVEALQMNRLLVLEMRRVVGIPGNHSSQ